MSKSFGINGLLWHIEFNLSVGSDGQNVSLFIVSVRSWQRKSENGCGGWAVIVKLGSAARPRYDGARAPRLSRHSYVIENMPHCGFLPTTYHKVICVWHSSSSLFYKSKLLSWISSTIIITKLLQSLLGEGHKNNFTSIIVRQIICHWHSTQAISM